MKITIETPFRSALLKSIEGKRNLGRFGAQVRQAAEHGSGKRSINDVSTNLSYKTYNQLKARGIVS